MVKFKLQANDLNEALGVVSIVPPRPVTSKGGAGFLFVVNGKKCRIYSRDALHQARVEVSVTEVEGEGAFIYPSDKIASMKYLDGWIEIEAGFNTEENRHWVQYKTEGGAQAERSSYDPRLMQSIDKQLDAAEIEHVFPVAVFREALNAVKGFLAKPTDGRAQENYKTMQLFDASEDAWKKGDGTLFASDAMRVCYFFCETFKGKGLAIHGQHLPFITSFLSKCSGNITIKLGDGVTYAVHEKVHKTEDGHEEKREEVLGWAHHLKQHEKFSYYPLKVDGFVLNVPKDILLKALHHVRKELDPKRDKIRIQYSHSDRSLQFRASEGSGKAASIPVGVSPTVEDDTGAGAKGNEENFAMNANINFLLDLIEPVRTHDDVELRVAIVPPKNGRKEAALFRTIEEFWLNDEGKLLIAEKGKPPVLNPGEVAHQCRVTRFMPSKD